MTATSACEAFAYKGTAVAVGEVIRSALFRGELDAVLAGLAHRKACAEEAERLEVEADEEAVDAAVEAFRYEHDLISAEETERWLEARGLTADDLQDHFTRSQLAQTFGDKVVPPARPELGEELLDRAGVELLFSGDFGGLAGNLARRLVAESQAEGPATREAVQAERRRFLKRVGIKAAGVGAWLAAAGRDEAWLERMLGLEAAYGRMRGRILTTERLARALAAARLSLTRIDVERIELESQDAAREAHLCVREDGLTLEEVAREARYPFERLNLVAEDLPEDERQRLLCATIGVVQEPARVGEVFRVDQVTRKTDPELADVLVRERIESKILDSTFAEAGSRDLRWTLQ